MRRLTFRALLSDLTTSGLAGPDAEERLGAAIGTIVERESTSPWYVRVLVGFGAWLASLFLIGVFGAVIAMASSGASKSSFGGLLLFFGVPLIAGAVSWIRSGSTDFTSQAALAMSLAGQALVVVGVALCFATDGFGESVNAGVVTAFLIPAGLIFMVDNAVHRFLYALIMAAALCWLVLRHQVSYGADALVCLLAVASTALLLPRPLQRKPDLVEKLQPVGYALLISFLLLCLSSLGYAVSRHFAHAAVSVAALGVLLPGVSWLALRFLDEQGFALGSRESILAVGGALLLGLLTYRMPGVMAALGALLLGFRRHDRVLIGLAAAFLCVFLAGFYYSLSFTLLHKSLLLVGSGAVLLGLRVLLGRIGPAEKSP